MDSKKGFEVFKCGYVCIHGPKITLGTVFPRPQWLSINLAQLGLSQSFSINMDQLALFPQFPPARCFYSLQIPFIAFHNFLLKHHCRLIATLDFIQFTPSPYHLFTHYLCLDSRFIFILVLVGLHVNLLLSD